MRTSLNTLPPSYFDAVYQVNEDPWSFATSDYEREKYGATLAALPNLRYENAFEIGCSIGVLTRQLAQRCDRLLAVDASELPLPAARQRLAEYPAVTIRQMAIPNEFPADTFDLILLSEVGYYLAIPDLTRARQQLVGQLRPNGQLLLVHWTPPVHDYPLTGDEVHDFFMELTQTGGPLTHLTHQRASTYRLDLFQRNPES
ncbi:class I SAM-dependent DNA methyltransferase [Spirosoma koreense]